MIITATGRYRVKQDCYGFKAGDIVQPTKPGMSDPEDVIRGEHTPNLVMMSMPQNRMAGLFIEESLLEAA